MRPRSVRDPYPAPMRIVRRVTSVVAVSVIGSVLIVAGLVMLVTPGPGLVAIIAGLAVWAREFRWAHRLLDRAKARLVEARAARRARRHPTTMPPTGTASSDEAPVTHRRVA